MSAAEVSTETAAAAAVAPIKSTRRKLSADKRGSKASAAHGSESGDTPDGIHDETVPAAAPTAAAAGSGGSARPSRSASLSSTSSSQSALARRLEPVLLPSGTEVQRQSLVRLLSRTLSTLGYDGAVASFHRESGVELESRAVVQFRSSVLRGDYDGATRALELLPRVPRASKTLVRRILAEQHFVALMEKALLHKEMHVGARADRSNSSNGAAPAALPSPARKRHEHKEQEHKHNGTPRRHHAPASDAAASASHGTMLTTAGLLSNAIRFLRGEVAPLFAPPPSSPSSKKAASAPSSSVSGGAASTSDDAPMAPVDVHLQHLSSLIASPSLAALHAAYRGDAVLVALPLAVSSAAAEAASSLPYAPVLARLAALLPETPLSPLPPNALLHMLEQPVASQVRQCLFHDPSVPVAYDLLHRRPCTLTLPSRSFRTLRDHEDEVLGLAFSHPASSLPRGMRSNRTHTRMRLASCSKDRTIKVFEVEQDDSPQKNTAADGLQDGAEEEKEEQKQQSNGVQQSNGASTVAVRPSAARMKLVCTSVLQAPLPTVSRPATPPSPLSSSDDESPRRPRRAQGSSGSGAVEGADGLSPQSPYFLVLWSPDNKFLLACNGQEAHVFATEDNTCVLTLGRRAVDLQAARRAAAAASTTNTAAAASGTGSSSGSNSVGRAAPAPSPASSSASPAASSLLGGGSGAIARPSSSSARRRRRALQGRSVSPPPPGLAAAAAAAVAAGEGASAAAAVAAAAGHPLGLSLLSPPMLVDLGLEQQHLLDESLAGMFHDIAHGDGRHRHHHRHGQMVHERDSIRGHSEGITAAAWVRSADQPFDSDSDAASEDDDDGSGAESTRFLLVTGSSDRRLILWDLRGHILDVWAGEPIVDVAAARGGRFIAATASGRCGVFQVRRRRIKEFTTLTNLGHISSVCLSRDGSVAAVSSLRPAVLRVFHLGAEGIRACSSDEEGDDTAERGAGAHSGEEEMQADGRTRGSSSTRKWHRSARSDDSDDDSDAYEPDRSRLSHSRRHRSRSSMPVLGSPPTILRELRGFRAHRFVVRSCFAGPGDSVLLSGSEDGLVCAWAVKMPQTGVSVGPDDPDPAMLARLQGHSATVNAVAATVIDGRQHVFASASDDHTIRLWRMQTQIGHQPDEDEQQH